MDGSRYPTLSHDISAETERTAMTMLTEGNDNGAASQLPSHLPDDQSTRCVDPLFSFTGHPGGVARGAGGAMWISDVSSGTIWQVAADGSATPVVLRWNGVDNRQDRTPRIHAPAGLAVAPDGSLFVADSTADRVCAVAPDGSLRVVAGGTNGYRDGRSTEAQFRRPLDVAFAPDGACYVADTGNDRIRRIAPDGTVTTAAGSIYDYGDGFSVGARFRRPGALDVDAEGNCFVADTGNNAIRWIAPDGAVTTLAGEPPGGDSDGIGAGVGLRWPTGVAIGPDGTMWVADHGNGALRRISPAGESQTTLRLAGMRWPVAVALGTDGMLVVAGAALDDVHTPEACLLILGDVP